MHDSRFYKVKDHPDLVKDMENKAVLSTNYAALMEYKKKQMIAEDIDTLKDEMQSIKSMLSAILDKLNK